MAQSDRSKKKSRDKTELSCPNRRKSAGNHGGEVGVRIGQLCCFLRCNELHGARTTRAAAAMVDPLLVHKIANLSAAVV